ncbi:16S rRNA (guanine(527)-N(7))-methyltransferase RsmG [Acetilactobacillus jinshanensis]|uniref:Ribosomal RNA small subunit methyltransferase G n=1 Tax=Acetilactobacillus jinshanensis TaxID=1720083 RepID=A0A4P6ZJY0_9LACO|nr:16S rRNA (guanine(527)-N(7))-methyltransferase RsmG [Acetilactobacillus jinshanensis]QBP17712.1 16S rRNA (guanine(527)-N(7))-methyltransferase RsmG [Acetilactobacillus jinshanensis]URL61744.1 16S rRNA (guanine(527)-N(7))-methyltransferase RsmG [uncultured bacterium]
MDPEEFVQALKKLGIKLNDHQLAQFDLYYHLLIKANQTVNLTTITSKPDVYLKHFYDSITPARFIEGLRHHSLSICDVGAGAGFPSLPLKIAFPQLKVTIIDSLNKRINFLRDLVHRLDLKNVKLYHARAEDFGSRRSHHREQYDLVIARAVARLNVLSEFCLPLARIGGEFVAMKSVNAPEELDQSRYAIDQLGGKVINDHTFKLPVSGDIRRIIVIRKQKRTPKKYPRKAGTPNRRPLLNTK